MTNKPSVSIDEWDADMAEYMARFAWAERQRKQEQARRMQRVLEPERFVGVNNE